VEGNRRSLLEVSRGLFQSLQINAGMVEVIHRLDSSDGAGVVMPCACGSLPSTLTVSLTSAECDRAVHLWSISVRPTATVYVITQNARQNTGHAETTGTMALANVTSLVNDALAVCPVCCCKC
jgi:hypothetical protein